MRCLEYPKLLTDAESFDNRTVSFNVVLEKVVKELSSLTDHLLHTSAGVVVLRISLEVLGELGDPFGENSDLNFGRTGVTFVNCEGLDDVLLVFLCDHGVSPFKKIIFTVQTRQTVGEVGGNTPCVRKPCKSAFHNNITQTFRFVNRIFKIFSPLGIILHKRKP